MKKGRMLKLKLMCVAIAIALSSVPSAAIASSATYYHPQLAGRRMANGRPYRPYAMTAASNRYKLGTRVRVINRRSGRSVVVTITDRCGNCYIDLSRAAFMRIASPRKGRVPVKIVKL